MLPSASDCDECLPAHLRRPPSTTTALLAALPFFLTFTFVGVLFQHHLFPLLSSVLYPSQSSVSPPLRSSTSLPATTSTKAVHDLSASSVSSPDPLHRLAASACASTVALAAVLAELVLCDVAGVLDPAFRVQAMRLTVVLLLILLLVVLPALEIRLVVMAMGGRHVSGARSAALIQAVGFAIWMLAFWWSGRIGNAGHRKQGNLISAGVEHVGVIGISLMALLSGFASVSASWQSFGTQPGPVSDASVNRKKAGLDATTDMLAAKQSRLRALLRKADDQPSPGLLSKALGVIRGHTDANERSSLDMEISGLENMALALASDLTALQVSQRQQTRAHTFFGRFHLAASHLFALYCAYRIIATLISSLHRHFISQYPSPSSSSSSSSSTSSTTDPTAVLLAFLPHRYASQLPLDRATIARPLAFLLSGVVLVASVSSALNTLRLGARYAPAIIRAARAALPLLIAQLGATYVLSAALLLQGSTPGGAGDADPSAAGNGGSARLLVLGGRDMAWVDGWFEAWFLAGALVTALGIYVGRKLAAGMEVDWDKEGEVELGKRS